MLSKFKVFTFIVPIGNSYLRTHSKSPVDLDSDFRKRYNEVQSTARKSESGSTNSGLTLRLKTSNRSEKLRERRCHAHFVAILR